MSCLANTSCLMPTIGAAPQMFAATLQFFAATQCLLNHDTIPESDVLNFQSFDFIIIGGGTAGSVVAKRLSEVKGWKILLIEAGGDPPVESNIPGLDSTLVDSEFNWKFRSTNNEVVSQGIVNGSIKLSGGKMFGGSSSLDKMHYIRGHDKDFQKWFVAGNLDWSTNDIHRCFKKAESLQNKKMLKDPTISKFYGTEGPLIINRCNSTYRNLTNGILKSWYEIGFKPVSDLHVAGLIGSGIVTSTASDGMRQSTYTGYITSIKGNVKILKNTIARKILITEIDDKKIAFGIEVEKNGKILTFYSTHEVIVSAGTVSTPKILMLSGIGPKEHLLSKNIICLVNSPMVGQNLQDHIFVPITVYGDEPEKKKIEEVHLDVINYLLERKGLLAESSLFTDITAFYSTQNKLPYPEFRLYLTIIPKGTLELKQHLTSHYGYEDSIVDSMVTFNKDHALYLFGFSLLHPYSKGNVSLSTNNYTDSPLIFTNYFSDPTDLNKAVQGIKMASKVTKSKFFKNIKGFLGRLDWPACDSFELNSDQYWECICVNLVTSTNHLVGTCKMGSDPNTSVVDGRLKVHGVTHLRVIDASVMPEITSGSVTAATVMIAERGAEFIKEEYNNL